MREGTLIVVVSRASNLYNSRSVSKQNPFCAVRIQNLVHKTKPIQRGGQSPAWDFEARFKLSQDLDSRFLKVSVFDDVGAKDPVMIGDCTIDLSLAYLASTDEGYDAWHKLTYGGKPTGEVYLEITWYPARRSSGRKSRASLSGSLSASASISALASNLSLSPSASVSSLSSVGSMASKRPLPPLPGSLTASRSPSPLRNSVDPNVSCPAIVSSNQSRSRRSLDADMSLPDLRPLSLHGPRSGGQQRSAYASLPGNQPGSPYGSVHGSQHSSQHGSLHGSLRGSVHGSQHGSQNESPYASPYGNPYRNSMHESFLDYHQDLAQDLTGDLNENLAIPEPPAHSSISINKSFEFDQVSEFEGSPEPRHEETKDRKNISHINQWYGKAMFQRFRK